MADKHLLDRFLKWWGEKVLTRPGWLLLLIFVAAGFCVNYTVRNVGIDTDTTKMVSPDLPFQKDRKRYERLFPQDTDAILLVVEASTPETTSEAIDQLGALLRAEKKHIKSVYIPGEDEFFKRQGLLYLDLNELETLAAELARAQPFIAKLYEDFSLRGFFSILSQALQAEDLPLALTPVLNKVSEAIQAVLLGEFYRLSWQQLMLGKETGFGTTERFMMVQPVLDFDQLLPAEQPLAIIHRLIDKVQNESYPDVSVRMTGEIMLEHEELLSVRQSMEIAGAISLILVCGALLIGLRSPKLMLATLITLVLGLIFSAAFATFAVGALNLISIAFAVLYIGLGVDYAIHLCLRYRELMQERQPPSQAMVNGLRAVGPSLVLCALTTAIGLYAFVPTAYAGISELGIIGGTSLFIALGVTFTILPALLRLMPLKPVETWRKTDSAFVPRQYADFPLRHGAALRWSAFLLTLLALGLTCQVKFDFNPVNLRNPNSESVKTFKYLMESEETSPMTIAVLADGASKTHGLENRLEQLDVVEKTVSMFDLVPDNQEEKLALIEEMALLLGPQLTQDLPPLPEGRNQIQAVKKFLTAVNKAIEKRQNTAEAEALVQLREQLERFIETYESLDPPASQALIDRLQTSLLSTLPYIMDDLQKGLEAAEFGLQDIPKDLAKRWLSPEGVYRIQVFPEKDLNKLANLRAFVNRVRTVAPQATDLPVIYLETMNAIIGAFQQAFVGALVAITVLLLLILRNLKDTLLVLLPLILAAVFTGASTVVFNIPFNFANIIVLPLLFGLGVDNGIHMVNRLRHFGSKNEKLLTTSTARGVFYTALTTIFSFMSLGFQVHAGIASIGQLLAIGLFFTLLCTLLLLPAFSIKRQQVSRIDFV